MDSQKKEDATRRKFIKKLSGAIVFGCACFSLDRLAVSAKDYIKENKGREHLAAACGTYCGACPAYLAKHGEEEHVSRKQQKTSSSGSPKALKGIPDPGWMDGLLCDGCLSGGILVAHCQHCNIRKCAEEKQKDSRCSDCPELPCYRVTNLINMGHYLHRQEYLPNLKKIREMGVQLWVISEEARWRCPLCGLPMSWYDAECAQCGAPRSEQLFPLG